MGDTIYIKSAAFVGYDRDDVDKRLEQLYTMIYDLKNQLRENKNVIQKLENGESIEKSIENALAVEKASLTNLQVKNENLTEKYRSAKDRAEKAEKENEELKAKLAEVSQALEKADSTVKSLSAGDNAAGLSVLFAEAQKSAEFLKESARTETDALKAEADKYVRELIADTNDKAAEIIYEAEKKAADIVTAAENRSEQMAASNENLKAAMLVDVDKLSEEITRVKEALIAFQQSGIAQIENSVSMLSETRAELTDGGVPQFRIPEEHMPVYPEMPEKHKAVEEKKAEDTQRKSALDKLQAMAESIGDNKKSSNAALSLDQLMAQAKSIGGSKEEAPEAESPKAEQSKSDNPASDLMKLMEKARAIEAGDAPKSEPVQEKTVEETPKKEEPKKKNTIDLAELARQAAALES